MYDDFDHVRGIGDFTGWLRGIGPAIIPGVHLGVATHFNLGVPVAMAISKLTSLTLCKLTNHRSACENPYGLSHCADCGNWTD